MTKQLSRGNAIPRFFFVAIAMLFQLGWILLMVLVLNDHYPWIALITRLLSVCVILRLNSGHTNAAYKIPWIMLILTAPIMGLSLYLMMGFFGDLGHAGKRLRSAREAIRHAFPQNIAPQTEPVDLPHPAAGISRYLHTQGYPLYTQTAVDYFPQAVDAFQSMKADLEKAESFIFLEYFIVSDGIAFQELCDILIRKARQGVDVRLMYDDFGSVGYVNMLFAKRLADAGIRCRVFNPAVPVLNLFMNHRDHRKITVIDGKVGYTGGYNLSDEYFGRQCPYGHWKDTGLRLEGDGVLGLTADFLEMWCAATRSDESFAPYLIPHPVSVQDGFVQPYGDDPLTVERRAESVYLNLIYSARESLYIMTPYLIITDEMGNALAMAAKRGVDVRIITPGTPDKKAVYAITRSYYPGLAANGVRIFEYTPGFCHGKQMLCDGMVASVGTSNLDYRSLYLHFENNVVLYGGNAVKKITEDFHALFPLCREVTQTCLQSHSPLLKLGQSILRLFAPLL